MLYARFLSPTSDLLLLQQISNTYGNSMGWLNSANTGKGAAAAYQQVSVPNTNNMIPGYGTASMAGQLQIAAQGATVDINDSVMTNNLQALGTIRANQTARQTDIANLEAATQTQDPSQQTIMAELQRINQALLLQLRTLQDANQINANLALQQIVAQKQQQDAMKSAFRDSAGYESYYNANITTTSGGCGESPYASVLSSASKEDRRAWNMGQVSSTIIAQACQSLAATAAPSITAMGIHIVLALATIMLVWFGVQEALASAHGGPGFSMGRFLNLFMLLTFAYVMVNYYDSSIPGLGFSIKGFIDGGTINLVNLIGSDGSTTMLNEIHAASSKTGPSILNSMMSPYYAIVYFVGAIPVSHAGRDRFRNPGLRSDCGNDHRIARADLYPISCLRQTRLAVLGMAQGVSRIQLLQSRRRSHDECSVSCSDQLLHPTWPERVGPFIDGSDVAASCPSRTGQYLHPLQDSDHDAQLIHWRYWWTRWGPGRGDDGDTGRDVNAQDKKRGQQMSTETTNVETKSHPGNHSRRGTLPGAVRRSAGDEYLS